MKTKSSDRNEDVGNVLEGLTKELHAGIGAAGLKGDTSTILSLTERLRRVDGIRQQYEAIQRATQTLAETGSSVSPEVPVNGSLADGESRRVRANLMRNKWLAQYGATLAHVHGTIYRNSRGEKLGIAFSSGKKVTKGRRWWLGLPEGEFDCAVLLCAEDNENVRAVCLPQGFMARNHHLLYKSEGGQEQFNIFQRDGKWNLRGEDVSGYIDKHSVVL